MKGILALLVLGGIFLAVSALFSFVQDRPGAALLVALGAAVAWGLRRRGLLRREAAAAEARRARLLGYELADLDALSGAEFEAWIAEVLTAAGFRTEDIRTSGDFGVDVIAEIDGVRFGIQAKRYSANVGNSAVQEANAGAEFHRCDVPAVVTQSGFTRAALAQAARSQPPCVLIGRDEIHEMAERLQRAGARVRRPG